MSKIYCIDYLPKDNEVNEIVEKIKSIGDIYYEFEFKEPENVLNKELEYVISGDKNNIVTKLTTNPRVIRILTKNILESGKEYNWKIKILKSKSKNIMVGIAQAIPEIIKNDINIKKKSSRSPIKCFSTKYLMTYLLKKDKTNIISNYGWYYSFPSSNLYSDNPQNYRGLTIK